MIAEKVKKRREAKKKGILLDEFKRGTIKEKSTSIEAEAQYKNTSLKVARDGNRHEHLLNETEQTLKFGLFMLTLMYFRAMTYLKREKKSWSGDDDEVAQKKGGKAEKVMTDERMRMIDEENKAIARKKKVKTHNKKISYDRVHTYKASYLKG